MESSKVILNYCSYVHKSTAKDASNPTNLIPSRYQVKDAKHYTEIHLPLCPNISAGKSFTIYLEL